jgi:hypothetical protein
LTILPVLHLFPNFPPFSENQDLIFFSGPTFLSRPGLFNLPTLF